MAYSFPVYRRGLVFKTLQVVGAEEAEAIARRIIQDAQIYLEAFQRAALQENNASGFQVDPKEQIKRQTEESFILNFPAMRFRLAEFGVHSRISVTVCQDSHRSKIWVRLTCAELHGKPAYELTFSKLERFFQLAARKAQIVLPALAKQYCKHVTPETQLPLSQPYYFQLRAFNSLNPASQKLYTELRNGLSLTEAFEHPKYRTELRNYFALVFARRVDAHDVRRAVWQDKIDVFGYKSERYGALYTAKTTRRETDLCGYGYDATRKLGSRDVLSQATTREILNEYAQEF